MPCMKKAQAVARVGPRAGQSPRPAAERAAKAAPRASPRLPLPMRGEEGAAQRPTAQAPRGISWESDDSPGGRSPQLAAAHAAKKSNVRAVERSQRFAASVHRKLEDLCDDLASCSTSCRSESFCFDA